jgi:hypothetical protein
MADSLVVRTEELASVLRLWIDKHNDRFMKNSGGRRPSYKYIGEADEVVHLTSAYDYICFQMGKPPGFARVIHRVLTRETKHTELRIADGLLTAIEESGALTDGRITVMPNPRWSQERWIKWKGEQGCI